jgi:hypothetical protein
MPVDALPAAFSVPSQVETVGALAGLAAILGLAVLSMLYFAQARELKRLREWAGRAPERAAEAQERAMATGAMPRRATPQPVPSRSALPVTPATQRPGTPGAPAAAAGAAAAAAGAKPATPGAPAAPGTPAAPAAPGTGKPATAAASAAAGAAATPATPGEAAPSNGAPPTDEPKPALDDTQIGTPPAQDDDDATGDQATTAQPRPAVPKPLPVPPGARTAAGAPGAAGAAAGAAASAARGPAAAPRPTARPRPAAAPLRSGSPSATVPPRAGQRGGVPLNGGNGDRRGLRIGLIAFGAVVVVVAIIFAITQLTGGGGDKSSSTTKTTATTATNQIGTPGGGTSGGGTKTSATAAPPKADTTVAVLNGTTVAGLAANVADKVAKAGYKKGTVTNAPDQQRAATQVYYEPGQKAAALQVARTIDVGKDAVVPIDDVTSATAGSDASVVVVVGSDQSP